MNNVIDDIIQKERDFEQLYLSLRAKEGRLYPDELVAMVPDVPNDHSLKKEWDIRKNSCERLIKYLSGKQRPLEILEIGCGNGWLCNQLSGIKGSHVTGTDINRVELEQARRVFSKPNLLFIHGGLDTGYAFDIIIFAASFQYFRSVNETLRSCFDILNKGGEIHIINTKFYSPDEIPEARERSRQYFISAGAPAMHQYYFHHTLADLDPYNYKIMFNPKSLINKLIKNNPFPWICLTK